MRLGDMNNLKAQALNEDMQKRVGWNFGNLERLSVNQASAMLENVDTKLSAVKKTKKIHESEKDTVYNGLVMAKQVLESYIAEKAVSKSQQQAAGAALAAKRGDAAKSKLKGASKAMAKMSTKELEKIAGTKHKGLPEKVDEAEYSAKKAAAGKDIGKPGKQFEKIAKKAGKKYGSEEKGKKVAGAVLKKLRANESINESVEARLDEGYSASEQAVDDTFNAVMDRLLSMAKIMREDGALAKNVDAIGGDSTFMRNAYRSMHSAYDKVANAHQGALGHVMHTDESASQGMFEDEVGQAETIMAAQDMVDSIQGMLEDVGQMINEKLPPLTDSIRRSNGADAAAAFNQQTNSALNALMDAVRAARESMASAVGTLSGEAPTAMTSVDTGVVDQPEVDMDLGADEELDDFAASDAATGGDEPLGRSKRA